MKTKIHALAGAVALLCIISFWVSTVSVELLGSPADIAFVKQSILRAMLVLIPSMAIAGASGFSLARGRTGPVIARKTARMKLIAMNGLGVLLPSAVFLAWRAGDGHFDVWFYTVQAVELIAGAVNITLLSRNVLDGLKMTRRRTRRRRPA